MQEFIEIPATLQSLNQRKPLFGVGINDADYAVCPKVNGRQVMCPYYTAWKSMIERCYGPKFQERKPTYKGCSVTKEWLTFSSFRRWMKTQNWQGKQLDKDLLAPGNKMYSPDTCIFVSGAINNLLNDHAARKGKYPQGVNFHKQLGKYKAQCSVGGKQKHLGLFSTIPEAEYEYLAFKSSLVKSIAYEPEAANNPKLQAALLSHSKIFSAKAEEINLQKNLAVL